MNSARLLLALAALLVLVLLFGCQAKRRVHPADVIDFDPKPRAPAFEGIPLPPRS